MKVLVFSDSTLCVGESNPDPSNNWATNLEHVMEQTWIWRKIEFGYPRGAIHLARATRCFYRIEEHIQKYLNGQNPESTDERITFMSMFDDIGRTDKGNTETCLHNANELAA